MHLPRVVLKSLIRVFFATFLHELVEAAVIDLLLYFTLPDVAICYRCKAHHRGFDNVRAIPSFSFMASR